MLLDLVPIIKEDGAVVPFSFDEDFSTLEAGSQLPFIHPVHITGTAKNISGTVEIRGSVKTVCSTKCDRCLSDIEFNIDAPFFHDITEDQSEDNDEILVADKKKIDLSRVAQLALLVEYPSKQLCKEDCRGLCMICGADLNKGDCGCGKKDIDPRLAVLKQLID